MEANFSVMTTIPGYQDLELLMAPFLIMNSQLTLTHQLEWDCKCPYFQEEQFISCFKIPNPSLTDNQKVRAKIPCGFKVKGSGQLGEFALVCEWKLNISHCKQGLFKILSCHRIMFLIILKANWSYQRLNMLNT